MDTLQQHKATIYKFVLVCVSPNFYTHDKCVGGDISREFKSYLEFRRQQRAAIDALDLVELKFIQENFCKIGKFGIYSDESCLTSRSNGFFFGCDGKMVMMTLS